MFRTTQQNAFNEAFESGDMKRANLIAEKNNDLDISFALVCAARANQFHDDKSLMQLLSGAKSVLKSKLLNMFQNYGHFLKMFLGESGLTFLDHTRMAHVYSSLDKGQNFETAYAAMLKQYPAPVKSALAP